MRRDVSGFSVQRNDGCSSNAEVVLQRVVRSVHLPRPSLSAQLRHQLCALTQTCAKEKQRCEVVHHSLSTKSTSYFLSKVLEILPLFLKLKETGKFYSRIKRNLTLSTIGLNPFTCCANGMAFGHETP